MSTGTLIYAGMVCFAMIAMILIIGIVIISNLQRSLIRQKFLETLLYLEDAARVEKDPEKRKVIVETYNDLARIFLRM